jgi:hypothetical protein
MAVLELQQLLAESRARQQQSQVETEQFGRKLFPEVVSLLAESKRRPNWGEASTLIPPIIVIGLPLLLAQSLMRKTTILDLITDRVKETQDVEIATDGGADLKNTQHVRINIKTVGLLNLGRDGRASFHDYAKPNQGYYGYNPASLAELQAYQKLIQSI